MLNKCSTSELYQWKAKKRQISDPVVEANRPQ